MVCEQDKPLQQIIKILNEINSIVVQKYDKNLIKCKELQQKHT